MDPKNQRNYSQVSYNFNGLHAIRTIRYQRKLNLHQNHLIFGRVMILRMFLICSIIYQSPFHFLNKPKQHRIGCRQQRKRKFLITDDLNVETWINKEVSHVEIIRNERKVSQSPLRRETSASGKINELYYLPKTPKRLIDPDVNQETSKQLSHSLLRFMKWQTSRYSWVEYAEQF